MDLKKIIRVFNEKNNGRIYHKSLYNKVFFDLEIRLRSKTRKDKIKKIYGN